SSWASFCCAYEPKSSWRTNSLVYILAIFILREEASGASVTNTSHRGLGTACMYWIQSMKYKPCRGSPRGRNTASTEVEPRKDTLVPGVKYSSGVPQVYSKVSSEASGSGAGIGEDCDAGGSVVDSATTGVGAAAVVASVAGPLLYQSSKSSWLIIGLPNSRAFCALRLCDAGSCATRTSQRVLDTPVLYSNS